MSLIVTICTSNGLLIAGDRRIGSFIHPDREPDAGLEAYPEALIFFDGCQKIIAEESSPHNFVAFGYTGEGSVDCNRLIRDTLATLPGRVSIKEYAEAVAEQLRTASHGYLWGTHDDVTGSELNIAVAGYDPNASIASGYMMRVPETPEPSSFIEGTGLIAMGTGDHLGSAVDLAKDRLRERITRKMLQASLGESDYAKAKAIVTSLRRGEIPYSTLSRAEAAEVASTVISSSSEEQVRRNEQPTIGQDVDAVWISRKKGVELLAYEPHMEIGSRRVSKRSNHHYILWVCECGHETRFQVDFEDNIPLAPGLQPIPEDLQTVCAECARPHSLSDITTFLQTKVVTKFHLRSD